MSRRILTLVAALVLFATTTPAPVQAQACSGTSVSQTCQWTASVTVLATLSCSVTQSFSFGSWPSSAGIVAATEVNSGRVVCTTDPGNRVNVSFTLPASLTGPSGSVPIIFGNESARLYDASGSSGVVTTFNPALGFANFQSNSGSITATLGENGPGNAAAEVAVNLSGASAGLYSGTIQITVVLQ